MLAFIAIFFPAVIAVLFDRWVLKNKYSRRLMLLEYIGCAAIINLLVIFAARVLFGNRGNVVNNLNTYHNFAFKYILLSVVLALIIPLFIKAVQYAVRSLLSVSSEEYLNGTKMTDKLRHHIIVFIFLFCAVILVGLSIYQYFRYAVYQKIDLTETELADSSLYSWCVDSLEEQNDIYEISGWIIRKEEDIESRYIQLIIVNEDGSAYLAPTEMVERTDVTTYFNGDDVDVDEDEGYDYDNSGFSSTINKKYVQSEQSQIYILYRNNGRYEIVNIGATFEIEEEEE